MKSGSKMLFASLGMFLWLQSSMDVSFLKKIMSQLSIKADRVNPNKGFATGQFHGANLNAKVL